MPKAKPSLEYFGVREYNSPTEEQSAVCLEYHTQSYKAWLSKLNIKPGWYAVIACDEPRSYKLYPTLEKAEAGAVNEWGTYPYIIAMIPE